MPLSPRLIRSLRTRARQGTLEVEHVLHLATVGDHDGVALLDELIPATTDEPGKVPFSKWKAAVVAFLLDGYAELERLADLADNLPFVVGVLEELKTKQAVDVLLRIALDHPDSGARVSQALNLILSFKQAPVLDNATAERARALLHVVATTATTDAVRATALLALRGVGDESSLRLLDLQAPFEQPWHTVLANCRSAIRRRLRTAAR